MLANEEGRTRRRKDAIYSKCGRMQLTGESGSENNTADLAVKRRPFADTNLEIGDPYLTPHHNLGVHFVFCFEDLAKSIAYLTVLRAVRYSTVTAIIVLLCYMYVPRIYI